MALLASLVLANLVFRLGTQVTCTNGGMICEFRFSSFFLVLCCLYCFITNSRTRGDNYILKQFSAYFQWLIGRCSVINGASIMQDRDLGIYKPAESTTSRHLPCSHELCLGSGCTNPKQPCPYNIDYFSENTTSSGLLIEDTVHFYSREGHVPVNASVIIG